MTRIKKLTPEQEALMAVVRGDWLDSIFKNDQPIDIAAATDGIAFLYGLENLKPPRVIVCESPMACQLAVNGQVYGQVYDQTYEQIRGRVSNQVHEQVYKQVRDQLCDKASIQVKDQVYDQVRDPIYTQVCEQVRDQVYDQTCKQVREQKLKYFDPALCDVLWTAGWLSFYDYFRRVGVINHAGLNKYIAYARSGVFYSIFCKDFAVLCDRPAYIKRDENSRLHADGAPAILWRDGWHNISCTA